MDSPTNNETETQPDEAESSTTSSSQFATVEATLGVLGKGSEIIINGQDVSLLIDGFHVSSGVRDVTRFVVEGPALNTKIKGEGIVEVMVDAIPISMLLRNLDPAEIEAAALARLEWGDGTITEKVLEVLIEAAEEAERAGS